MRAIKCKHGYLGFITSEEAKLYNKIEVCSNFCSQESLNERECLIAEELYKKNAVRKIRKGEKIGYSTYKETV